MVRSEEPRCDALHFVACFVWLRRSHNGFSEKSEKKIGATAIAQKKLKRTRARRLSVQNQNGTFKCAINNCSRPSPRLRLRLAEEAPKRHRSGGRFMMPWTNWSAIRCYPFCINSSSNNCKLNSHARWMWNGVEAARARDGRARGVTAQIVRSRSGFGR